jgi:hypothetical protein
LSATLSSIQIEVNRFDSNDSSKGFSEQTGNILAKMACLQVDGVYPAKRVNVCQDIISALRDYSLDSNTGISPETAKILDAMSGGKCF